ncbi:MAG: 50S ribosomal protein L24 [Coriobacteriales bacterium]
MNIKTGDTVKVITGKDKGVQGEVISARPAEGRVVVRGVNLVKKALHPTQANPNGGIDTREAPIDVSNVMLVCPECGLPTRVGARRDDEGKKVRVCKKCGKDIDLRV